jgi:hypothetical protein
MIRRWASGMKWIIALLAFLASPGITIAAAPTFSVVELQIIPEVAIYENAGQEVMVQYVVTNSLAVPITDGFSIRSMLGVAAVCPRLPSGSLGPGEQIVCTGSYFVTRGDMNAPSIVEMAMACNDWLCSDDSWALIRRRPLRTVFPLMFR